jgi:hypothetical protein
MQPLEQQPFRTSSRGVVPVILHIYSVRSVADRRASARLSRTQTGREAWRLRSFQANGSAPLGGRLDEFAGARVPLAKHEFPFTADL